MIVLAICFWLAPHPVPSDSTTTRRSFEKTSVQRMPEEALVDRGAAGVASSLQWDQVKIEIQVNRILVNHLKPGTLVIAGSWFRVVRPTSTRITHFWFMFGSSLRILVLMFLLLPYFCPIFCGARNCFFVPPQTCGHVEPSWAQQALESRFFGSCLAHLCVFLSSCFCSCLKPSWLILVVLASVLMRLITVIHTIVIRQSTTNPYWWVMRIVDWWGSW